MLFSPFFLYLYILLSAPHIIFSLSVLKNVWLQRFPDFIIASPKS